MDKKELIERFRRWASNNRSAHWPIAASIGGASALFMEIWLLDSLATALAVYGFLFAIIGVGFGVAFAVIALLRSLERETG